MSSLRIYQVLTIFLLCIAACSACEEDEMNRNMDQNDDSFDEDDGSGNGTVCIDTHKRTRMNSNIKAFVPKSKLTAYNNQSGIFASDKMEEKFRVNINTCKTSTMLFLLKISMEKDDFVQTNRVRYEGTTCHPRFFQSSRSVLFGMKKAANSKSKYTVAYFCPDSNMYGNTIALLTCEKVRNYVMNKSIFNSLLEYITANVQSAYKMLLTPKYQLCKIFKTAQEGCNIYSFANTTLCQ